MDIGQHGKMFLLQSFSRRWYKAMRTKEVAEMANAANNQKPRGVALGGPNWPEIFIPNQIGKNVSAASPASIVSVFNSFFTLAARRVLIAIGKIPTQTKMAKPETIRQMVGWSNPILSKMNGTTAIPHDAKLVVNKAMTRMRKASSAKKLGPCIATTMPRILASTINRSMKIFKNSGKIIRQNLSLSRSIQMTNVAVITKIARMTSEWVSEKT